MAYLEQSIGNLLAQVKTIRKNVELLQPISGVGPHSASLIMAEIGDVRRFNNKKALVAFAGVDALPFQSGTFESKSRHVSKRGSPHPRRTLFIISSVILQLSHEDNPVFCFMDKKGSEGKHFYVYIVAGAAKFLRIYYATVTAYFKTSKYINSLSAIAG